MQLVAPTTPDAHPSTRSTALRSAGRWMLGFAGFPLGGFASMLAIGPVDAAWKAVAGGLLTGAVVGGAQALALGRNRLPPAGSGTCRSPRPGRLGRSSSRSSPWPVSSPGSSPRVGSRCG